MIDEQSTEENKEFSEAEYAELREKTLKFYKERMSLLQAEFDYVSLQSNISKARAEGLMYEIKLAQLAAGPPEEKSQSETSKKQDSPRSLKKH